MNRAFIKSGILYFLLLLFVLLILIQKPYWNVFHWEGSQISSVQYQKITESKEDGGKIHKTWEKISYQKPEKLVIETADFVMVQNEKKSLLIDLKSGAMKETQRYKLIKPEVLTISEDLGKLMQAEMQTVLGYEDWKGVKVMIVSFEQSNQTGNETKYWIMKSAGMWLPLRIVVFENSSIKSKSSFIYSMINDRIEDRYFNIEEWIRRSNVKYIEIHNRRNE